MAIPTTEPAQPTDEPAHPKLAQPNGMAVTNGKPVATARGKVGHDA